jgi:hypothetical protein
MKKILAASAVAVSLIAMATALAQQRPADAPPIVEAKKEVVVNWTLGAQTWEFKSIKETYEPVKGSYDPLSNEARWTLQLARDLEPGAAGLHNNIMGTPFQPTLLTAEKMVFATDAKVQMTASSGKMGDTIEVYIQLPEAETLATIKYIRLERRTNVGF